MFNADSTLDAAEVGKKYWKEIKVMPEEPPVDALVEAALLQAFQSFLFTGGVEYLGAVRDRQTTFTLEVAARRAQHSSFVARSRPL